MKFRWSDRGASRTTCCGMDQRHRRTSWLFLFYTPSAHRGCHCHTILIPCGAMLRRQLYSNCLHGTPPVQLAGTTTHVVFLVERMQRSEAAVTRRNKSMNDLLRHRSMPSSHRLIFLYHTPSAHHGCHRRTILITCGVTLWRQVYWNRLHRTPPLQSAGDTAHFLFLSFQ